MIADMAALVSAVQTNCDIADARHARDVSLCTYLLGMREFYRWEHELPCGESPPRDDVGRWIAEREARWEDIAEEDFVALPVAGQSFEPFAAQQVNDALAGSGLVYGAGLGRFHKPHFFLGRLDRDEQRGSARLLVCGCEYARDVSAIPAASQGTTMIVRREALRQWLWEKAEGWNLKQRDGALKSALLAYGFDVDPVAAIERMVDGEIETLVLHEEGEIAAGHLLGDCWPSMLASFSGKRAELLARAVRDNLADCLVTLPTLLQRGRHDSLHFWFSTFDGLRRELFPSLVTAYTETKVGDGDTAKNASLISMAELEAAAEVGAVQFATLGRRLLELDEPEIEELSLEAAAIAL
ncbi:MAG: hypothetical protein K9J42_02130 [Sulfuritalea sp.]|nr:hypothetical protein [Sulfuritalea sp.]